MSRSFREVFGATLLMAVGLGSVLLAGQAAQIHRALGAHLPWQSLLLGLAALGEVLLPVSCLLGVGLAYGRWRNEGALTALSALGVRPVRLLLPAILAGLTVSGVTFGFSTHLGPRALAALADRWDVAVGQAAHAPGGVALTAGRARGVVRADGTPGEIWAISEFGADLAVLRAEALEFDPGGGARLRRVELFADTLRARLGEVRLDDARGPRRPGALRPPQTLPDASLPLDGTPEVAFTRGRRRALAALGVPAAILGALLGGSLGRTIALLSGAGVAGVLYWALRAGSLAARDGHLSPGWAAWLPFIVLAALAGLSTRLAWARFRA